MSNAFEYGDALLTPAELQGSNPENFSPKKPYLNLATCVFPSPSSSRTCTDIDHCNSFRMVVLADEILESFFDADLSASFQLEPVPISESMQPQKGGFLGGFVSTFISNDENRKLFNTMADSIGKTMGKHQVRTGMAFLLHVLTSPANNISGHHPTIDW
jgi:hypothetical protein